MEMGLVDLPANLGGKRFMFAKKIGLAVTVAFFSFLTVLDSYGQWSSGDLLTSMSSSVVGVGQKSACACLGLRKYINSFTSYEFSDAPGGVYGDPISRLEWPWEQTFGVIKLGSNYYGLQVNFEGAATLFKDSGLLAQDSDWLDPGNHNQKTVFSDGLAMPRNWTIDTSIGFGVPIAPNIQWLLGYRVQQFRFTYTDVTQWELGVPGFLYLPREGIQFSQNYKQYYGGGELHASLDLGRSMASLTGYILFLKLQGDVAYVTANNVDFHVLRKPGPRFTYESTRGKCLHLKLAADFRFRNGVSLGLLGDFMNIRTSGGHHWTEPGIDMSWDVARAWSEQKYIEVNGALTF
jgi:hypothetical protein